MGRWFAVLAVLAFVPAALAETVPTAPAAKPAAPAAAQPGAQADGFRSARWGMSEAEVKAAIRKDFDVPADRIRSQYNRSERTAILAVTVNNLIEGAGPAEILYIFGYKSKRLIQVNIEWGTPVDPRIDPQAITAAANELRDYFLTAGYAPQTVTVNARLSDQSVIVFRGQDAQKHTTLLRLITLPSPASRNGSAAKQPQVALILSYIADAENPDIFRLKKGQF